MNLTTAHKNGKIKIVRTYFVYPDRRINKSLLEFCFSLGYESYLIPEGGFLDIESKIQIAIDESMKKGELVILFFNIDKETGINWLKFISHLSEKYLNNRLVRIGVMHHRKRNEQQIKMLNKQYLFDIGINAGCIKLKDSLQENRVILSKALKFNEAKGTRECIRVCCNTINRRRTFSFEIKNKNPDLNQVFSGTIKDISQTHFSIVFDGPYPDLEIGKIVQNININIPNTIYNIGGEVSGLKCHVKAQLIAKRKLNGLLHVFVFIKNIRLGRQKTYERGLESGLLTEVQRYLFETYQAQMEENCTKLYYSRKLQVVRAREPEKIAVNS